MMACAPEMQRPVRSHLWGATALQAHRRKLLLGASAAGGGGSSGSAQERQEALRRLLAESPPVDARRAALAAVAPCHPAAYDPAFVLPFATQVCN